MFKISLPSELWSLISLKLDSTRTRIRFRAVCKSWMSLLPQPRGPWLMLAHIEEYEGAQSEEEEQESSRNADKVIQAPPPPRGFASLGDRQIYYIDLPQLQLRGARCVGSTCGWLITVHKDRTMRLLNPLSKQEYHLPPLWKDTPKEEFRDLYLRKVILSSSPANGRDCIAMVINNCQRTLALARLGDDHWTIVRGVNESVADVIFYKGHFYVISCSRWLFVCDIGDDLTTCTTSCLSEGFRPNSSFESNYLVECLGELLLVQKFIRNSDDITYTMDRFELYKFDLLSKKWNVLKSLGAHSVFVGFNTSIALRASDFFGSMKKNCVYFTDDFFLGYYRGRVRDGHETAVFSLDDNTITPHLRDVTPDLSDATTRLYEPPVWIIPT